MANIVAKTLVSGAFAAGLAAAVASSAMADHPQFSGPPIHVDPYNTLLAAAVPPSIAVDVRFTGRLLYLDAYNATLAAIVSSVRTVALDDLYTSYAFEPSSAGPRLWEGATPFVK
jgi:hypothetical protein